MAKPEKAPKTDDTTVSIQFGKYISVYREVEKLADKQMRPIGLQIAYMLKKQLDALGSTNEAQIKTCNT